MPTIQEFFSPPARAKNPRLGFSEHGYIFSEKTDVL